ncbi:ribosomal-protein-alanine N-acetyltransferase [Desulfacinum hydrothermale DSM 13146]|uniref:Ribosomal-protein-alanine N-acetyltransferase n=1 Tax=Desulfacinum hydrothermale DSM 13146 TaxID=1121390 RepID=A0A1W1XRW8_9BACT|nr:ribosomal protein S18-alanine N-acetyltransferase [Desulfacinum hydrothermale]SMC26637.1 ribosomal-protein-alanine N-acetyltransferase [Desulfacinum hydrothermale DSM 13146]
MKDLPPIQISPMRKEDLPGIMEIERASHLDPWGEAFFLEEMERPQSRVLVARNDAKPRQVMGYICFWLVADEIQIFNVAVHPACRRRGLGRRLLLEALKTACRAQARTALLEVRKSNQAAQRLYIRLGFRPTGVRPDYYQGVREPAVLMELEMDRPWRTRWLAEERW